MNPIGLDTPAPRFSWTVDSPRRGGKQSAYRVVVTAPDGAAVWDSGKVASARSVNVTYAGAPLTSHTNYAWTVTLWDAAGAESAPAPAASFETAFLSPAEWQGTWVRGGGLFRTTFTVSKPVVRSRVYISGLGYYVLHINGRRIGDHVPL